MPASNEHFGVCIFDFYTDLGEVGRGNFAKVFKATKKPISNTQRVDPTVFAVKWCEKKNRSCAERLLIEWNLMKDVVHENLVRFHELYENDEIIWIVMDFAPHGNLMEFLQKERITERQASSVIWQLLSALSYVHQSGFCHRDVKPHNILIESQLPLKIKLADYGLVKQVGSADSVFWARQNSAGDRDFMSPEMLECTEEQQPLTADQYLKCDVFAAGVVLYYMLAGQPPARDYPDFSPLTIPPTITPAGVDILKMMMKSDPDQRPFAHELQQEPWFSMRNPSWQRSQSSDSHTMGQPKVSDALSAPVQEPSRGSSPLLQAPCDGMLPEDSFSY